MNDLKYKRLFLFAEYVRELEKIRKKEIGTTYDIASWVSEHMTEPNIWYDIYWESASIYYIVFGLVLMIISQIILKAKDLKDEQELTI